MTENDKQTRLRQIAVELAEIADSMEIGAAEPPLFPDWAEKRMDDRICLACKKPIKANRRAIRGMHESCNKTAIKAVKAGKTTEQDLIREGLMAPKRVSGRPYKEPTPLDEFLASPKLVAETAEGFVVDADQFQRSPGKSKPPPKKHKKSDS